jgi:hypothetical protein
MSNTVAEAISKEFKQILEEGPLTIQTCSRLERIAGAAKGLLAAVGGVAEAFYKVKEDQAEEDSPIVTTSAAETFGARLVQELIAVLPSLIGSKSKSASPDALVHAIYMARIHGMTDVAAEMETKLLGRPLDGERPVIHPDFEQPDNDAGNNKEEAV